MKMFSKDEERVIWCSLKSWKSDLVQLIVNKSAKNQDHKDLKIVDELLKRFDT